jgi:hypothetical protein
VPATSDSQHPVEIRQTLSVKETKAKALWVTLWVKTGEPESLRVILRRVGDSAREGAVLKEKSPTQTNMWERMVVSIQPPEDLDEVEVVIRLEGANRRAWVDEVQALHWTETANLMPAVADTFEQQLFLVDALRELLCWPTLRTHVHHLIGDYPCGTLQADGSERDNAHAYTLLNERIGDRVVRTRSEVPTFAYHTEGDWASDFNAAVPSCRDIPALSALATRRGGQVYLLLVNRTTDRAIETEIRLNAVRVEKRGEVRTLVGEDYDVAGARVVTDSIEVTNLMRHVVPPHCAQMVTFGLQDEKGPSK